MCKGEFRGRARAGDRRTQIAGCGIQAVAIDSASGYLFAEDNHLRRIGPSPQRQIEVGERGSVEDNLALKAGAALPSTWQHAKAKSPIAVRVAGKLSSCRAVQPSKAEMPM